MKKTRLLFSIFLFSIGVNIALAQVPAYVPTNGLVHFYTFNSNHTDLVSNVNGSAVNGATFGNDRFGNSNSALRLDGIDDYVNLSNTFFNGAAINSVTYSVWVNVPTLPPNAYNISAKESFWKLIRLLILPDGSVNFGGTSSGVYFGLGTAPGFITTNVWHHIAVTLENGTIKIFINGNLVTSGNCAASNLEYAYQAAGNSTATNLFGSWYPVSPGLTQFYNGLMDDFGLWNRALSNCEIFDLYNTQSNILANAGQDAFINCMNNQNGVSIGSQANTGVSYNWFPSTGLSSTTAANPTANPLTTTTYTVTATVNGNGCSSTDQVVVNVNTTSPIVNAGADQIICNGSAVTLSGTGTVSYTWNNNVNDGVPFIPATTETYTVVGTAANGCTNTDEVVVTVNPLPTVNPSPEQFVCTNNFTLPIIFSGNTPGTVFNWVNNNATIGLASSGTGNIPSFLAVNTAPVPLTAMITVTPVYTNNGVTCSGNSLPFFITINPGGYVQSISNVTACNGNTVNAISFGGSMNTTYSWVNSNVSIGLPASGNGMIPSFIAQNTGSTASVATITVSPVTTFSGLSCFSEPSTFTITVNPTPQVSAGPDQTVCAGTPVILSGSGASAYFWNNSVSNGVAFSPAASNTYTVTGTDANGCINTDAVVVTVNTLPTVNAGSDQSVCAGTSVTLSATGATNYTWSNNVSNGTAFTPAATNTYSVSGTDANGCSNTDQVLVTVNPLPNVNAGTDQTICNGDPVTLAGTGANTYAWNNNVTNGVAFNPMATVTYSVAGTDANGCSSSDEVVVIVNEATASTLTESALDSYTLNGQTYTQSGTYTQVLTNAAGCDSTITLNLTLSFTGLNELAQGIQLFPNPANDVLNIQSSAALAGEYTLYDAAGRAVLRGTFTGALTKIDVRNIAPGTYSLQAEEFMERIVVLRK